MKKSHPMAQALRDRAQRLDDGALVADAIAAELRRDAELARSRAQVVEEAAPTAGEALE